MQLRSSWTLAGVWVTSFFFSFIMFGWLGAWEIGWHPFWHHLVNPRVDASAFDLLCSAVAGTYAVAITVYLSAVSVFIVTYSGVAQGRREQLIRFLGNYRLFPAALFWYLATNLLVGGAWGFPRFWYGIVALIVIGPFAVVGFASLAMEAAEELRGHGGDHGHGSAHHGANRPHSHPPD